MHIHGQHLERYVGREMDDRTLALLDRHLGNCLMCATRAAEAGMLGHRWERRGWLGRLVRVAEPQPVTSVATRRSSEPLRRAA
jgi:hypothetical protein